MELVVRIVLLAGGWIGVLVFAVAGALFTTGHLDIGPSTMVETLERSPADEPGPGGTGTDRAGAAPELDAVAGPTPGRQIGPPGRDGVPGAGPPLDQLLPRRLLTSTSTGLAGEGDAAGRNDDEVPDGWDDDPALYGVVPDAPDLTPPSDLDPVLVTAEGSVVAPGDTASDGPGAEVTYTVELELGVEESLRRLVGLVDDALHDPRSWVHETALRQVEDPAAADIRVLLGAPATVDALCAEAGLDTAGRFSCWNGEFAALNAMRWEEGAHGFDDLTRYRRYLVNHEFGHGLGYGHVGCPAPGEPAPVMMQQTRGTDGCEPNAWPHLDAQD